MNGQDIWLARDFALLSCRAENWIQLFINFCTLYKVSKYFKQRQLQTKEGKRRV